MSRFAISFLGSRSGIAKKNSMLSKIMQQAVYAREWSSHQLVVDGLPDSWNHSDCWFMQRSQSLCLLPSLSPLYLLAWHISWRLQTPKQQTSYVQEQHAYFRETMSMLGWLGRHHLMILRPKYSAPLRVALSLCNACGCWLNQGSYCNCNKESNLWFLHKEKWELKNI